MNPIFIAITLPIFYTQVERYKVLTVVKLFRVRLARSIKKSAEFVKPNLVFIGLVGVIGFPLYYVIWKFLFPQEYENLILRVIGCLLFFPFVFHKFFFAKFNGIYTFYWLIAFIYALPFFFTYMLLMNNASAVWGMSTMAAILLLFLVVDDWILINIMFFIGTVLGWLLYIASGWVSGIEYTYLEQIPIYLFTLFAGSIFSHKAGLLKRERQQVIISVGNNIAHELRTPLSGIKNGIDGLKKYIPTLIEGYSYAIKHNHNIKKIRKSHFYAIETLLDRISSETRFSNAIIDMLLIKSGQVKLDDKNFETLQANKCLIQAIERYPFQTPEDKVLIQLNCKKDFTFRGSEILFTHVIFNLLKNSLYFIHKTQKGNVSIYIESDECHNIIRFRDTAQGIEPSVLPYIFDHFYTTLESGIGSGIGLYFCKFVMKSFGGDIKVISEFGGFSEFILIFREEV